MSRCIPTCSLMCLCNSVQTLHLIDLATSCSTPPTFIDWSVDLADRMEIKVESYIESTILLHYILVGICQRIKAGRERTNTNNIDRLHNEIIDQLLILQKGKYNTKHSKRSTNCQALRCNTMGRRHEYFHPERKLTTVLNIPILQQYIIGNWWNAWEIKVKNIFFHS